MEDRRALCRSFAVPREGTGAAAAGARWRRRRVGIELTDWCTFTYEASGVAHARGRRWLRLHQAPGWTGWSLSREGVRLALVVNGLTPTRSHNLAPGEHRV